MKVKELIEELQRFDPDMRVKIECEFDKYEETTQGIEEVYKDGTDRKYVAIKTHPDCE